LSLVNLKNLHDSHIKSDRYISPKIWLILPMLPSLLYSLWVIPQVIDLINIENLNPIQQEVALETIMPKILYISILGAISSILSAILSAYLLYMLHQRRNDHFERQQKFFGIISNILKQKTPDSEANKMFANSLESIKFQEIQRNAIFWAVLSVLPIINIIGVLFSYLTLMKVYYEHEINENHCIEDLRVILNQYNLSYTYERTYNLPRRNRLLYIILLLITFGLFGFYWSYILMKDPNTHFNEHHELESQLISLLEKTP